MTNRVYRGWIKNAYIGNRVRATKRDNTLIASNEAELHDLIDRIENAEPCKWLEDEVCVNDQCDQLADFPSEHYCLTRCELYEAMRKLP